MKVRSAIASREAMSKERMKHSVILTGTLIPFTTVFCFLAAAAIVLSAQNKPGATSSDTDAARRREAKATFESVCASCHGLDARGGERGPDLVSRLDVVRKTDAELVKILTNGKIAAGMPSFASYGPARQLALVSYLRTLQGRSRETPLPGDPARGKTIFFGKAKCAECHMIRGQGGFFAQDLTAYAARMDAEEVRAGIVNPNKDLDPRRGLVSVMLADSTTFSGVARNEDNFSLQLQTPDGVFHLLNKSDIRALTYTGRSPMPSDYGSTLSPAELNDLVSYLRRASGSENKRKAKNHHENGDEE
jgi:putative heme-binding domain-containing protein